MRIERRLATMAVAVILAGAGAVAPARAQTVLAKTNAQQAPDVRVEVRELKRTSGDTLTLRAVVVNDSDKRFRPSDMARAYLLDGANKKKYTVARDEKKKCICSPTPDIKAKSSAELWAKFAAPPEGVKKMTVVIPQFAPMEDVPIGQ